MAKVAYTPAEFLAGLPSEFADYREFEAEFIQSFNARRLDFPTGYGWRDALDWGLSRNYIRRGDRGIVIVLEDLRTG